MAIQALLVILAVLLVLLFLMFCDRPGQEIHKTSMWTSTATACPGYNWRNFHLPFLHSDFFGKSE